MARAVRAVRRQWWTGPGRYLLLSSALVVLLLQRTWTDAWTGDFWIYVATVGELQANPWHPSHPLFGGDGAFAFVSPYTWALGLLGRVTGIPAYEILVLQGLVNLVLFLAALYAFVSIWLRRPSAAFYALLFVLFLWGPGPWLFSSFFHLRSLALVFPYPSTFAAALALGTLAAFRWVVARGDRYWVPFVVPVGAFLWIVHPVNGVFLGLGLIACSLEARLPARPLADPGRRPDRRPCPSTPLATLPRRGPVVPARPTSCIEGTTRCTTTRCRAWLPPSPAYRSLRAAAKEPPRRLALLASALGLLVIAGGLFGASSYGRLLSHSVLMLQVVLADAATTLEERVGGHPWGALARPAFAAAAVALLVGLGWSGAVKPTLEESWRGDPLWLGFLGQHVSRQDIVLTDPGNCWYVPGFGAKVVAFPMPLPFAPDTTRGYGRSSASSNGAFPPTSDGRSCDATGCRICSSP